MQSAGKTRPEKVELGLHSHYICKYMGILVGLGMLLLAYCVMFCTLGTAC